ncbi:hypothetical protein [Nonomuraea bangladeshensis]|uniref:hypothetical protein n=1 Tax=Nonomuraea bangladeshensis TaxID=404385 RepID=UPI0031DE7370
MLAITFSAVMAFSLVNRIDGDIIIGAKEVLRVADTENAPPGASATERLEKFARDSSINVGRMALDLGDLRKRVLYLAVGDPGDDSADWLRDGYPAFNTDTDISVLPMAATTGLDSRGYYFLFGDHVDAGVIESFQEEIRSFGLTATVAPPLTMMTAYAIFVYGAPLQCFLAVCGAIICLVMLGVVFGCKSYGIHRLQGRGFAGVLGRDLKIIAAFGISSLSVSMLAAAGALFAYNRLHRFDFYLLIWFGILGLLVSLALVAHLLALLLAFRVNIPSAIKGEVPAKQAIVGIFGVRILSAGVALAIASALLVTWQVLDGKQEGQEKFRAAGDAVRISFNGTLEQEGNRQFREVGAWIRQADRAGQAIVSHRGMLADFFPEHAPYGEVLTVNDAYLARQEVRTQSGDRVLRDSGANHVRVLVPPALMRDEERIARAMSNWVTTQSRRNGVPSSPVEISVALAGQRLFTYGSGAAEVGNPLISDPIVVIVPAARIFSDIGYAAYASQASIIFTESDLVENARRNGAFRTYINGVEPIALRAAYEHRDMSVSFWFMLINLVIAVAVMMVSAIGMSHLYFQKNAQRIFAQNLFGWSAVRVHSRLLTAEVIATLLFVAYVAFDTLERWQFREQGAPRMMAPSVAQEIMSVTGWEPALAATLVCAGLCGSLGVLGVLGRRAGRNAAARM